MQIHGIAIFFKAKKNIFLITLTKLLLIFQFLFFANCFSQESVKANSNQILDANNSVLAYITNEATNSVSVINTATNTIITKIPVGKYPEGVCMSSDGTKVYVANYGDSTLSVINTATNLVEGDPIHLSSNPFTLCITPDGSKIYVTYINSTSVGVVNTVTNSEMTPISVGSSSPQEICIKPGGQEVYVTNYTGHYITVINTTTNQISLSIYLDVSDFPYGITFSPDGTKAYATNFSSNRVSVINTVTYATIANISVGFSPTGICISPDGSRAYITNQSSDNVSIVNTATNTEIARVGVGVVPEGISITPDGGKVYIANHHSQSVSILNAIDNSLTLPAINIGVAPFSGSGPFSVGNFIGIVKRIGITITASATSICPGSNVIFTATTINPGASPVYQWSKNGLVVGNNSPTYFDETLNETDVIQCTLTNATISATAVSNTISINMYPSSNFNITNSAASSCLGTASLQVNAPSGGDILNWYNNSNLVNVSFGTYVAKGITVAGGNGSGSAANQLTNPVGVFVDNMGNIFISGSDRIQKWAPGAREGVTVAGGNGSGSAANQLTNPVGVFVDNSGDIFVSDANNRIQKWTSGAASGVTVAGGNGSGNAANQLSNPHGVFVNKSGDIFVVDANNNRIQKWAPGATEGVTVAGGNGSGSAANQLSFPHGVFVNNSGDIFISDANNNRIQKWILGSTTGVTVAGGNGYGSAANQLSIPFGVFVDNTGNIFVADDYNNRIQKWAPGATEGVTVAGGNGSGSADYQLSRSRGVFVNNSGDIFVADADNHRIQKWPPWVEIVTTGITVAGGNGSGSAANKLNGPIGVFVDNTGNIFISDYLNQRIQKWAPGATAGVTVAGGNGSGSAANQLSNPVGVFVDNSGNIFVADANNNRIQKWLPGASFGITVAGGSGNIIAGNQLSSPKGVFVDNSGNIFVADANNNRIQKWVPGAPTGVTVAGGNGSGSAANQLNGPVGVFVDNTGNIFITDAGNYRIQKWAPGASAGVTVAGGNGSGSAANQLSSPLGVFVDKTGNIFISDALNQRIQKWAPGATAGVTVAGGNGSGSAANQLSSPKGVFVDNTGNIYVDDYFNNRVVKWLKKISPNYYQPSLPGIYTTVLIDNFGCKTTSNSITVTPTLSPTISIAASNTNVCANSSITFQATVSNAGSGPIYKWMKNNLQVGSNSSVYTDNFMRVNDSVWCIISSNTYCLYTTSSDTIKLNINCSPPLINSVSPNFGSVGSLITITGTGFNAIKGSNVVYFGAVKANISEASGTQLKVIVPADAFYQPITVLNLGSSKIGVSPLSFTPTYKPLVNDIFPGDFVPDKTLSMERDFKVADIDGDSYSDFIYFVNRTSYYGGSYIEVDYHNGTNSTFGLFSNIGNYTINSIAVADLDGDSVFEIIAGYQTNTGLAIKIFKQNSSNIYVPFSSYTLLQSTTYGLNNIEIADLDGDGKLDIVTGSGFTENSKTIFILQNTSTKSNISFSQITSVIDPGSSYYSSFILKDVDNDKRLDIAFIKDAVASLSQAKTTLQIYKNTSSTGNISFNPVTSYPIDVNNNLYFNYSFFNLLDIDGDNSLDLIFGYRGPQINLANTYYDNDTISIYRNHSVTGGIDNTSFSDKFSFDVGQEKNNSTTNPYFNQNSSLYASFGDLDGDGKLDFVVSKYTTDTVFIFHNKSIPGYMAFAEKVPLISGVNPRPSFIADINGDGKQDIITRNKLFLNNIQLKVNINPLLGSLCNGTAELFATSFNSDVSYHWSSGSNTDSTHITQPGTYAVTATNLYGATVTASVQVNNYANCGGYLELVTDPIVNYFDTIHVKINLRGGVDVLAAFAKLHYDNRKVRPIYIPDPQYPLDPSKAKLDYTIGDYLGTNLDNLPPHVTEGATEGVIDFGSTKTAGDPGSNGDGRIYDFRFVLTKLPGNVPFTPASNVNNFYVPFSLTNISCYNTNGLHPASFEAISLTSDTTICRYYTNVWPGDLNNDKKVGVEDILPIGYFYNSSGPIRPNGSINWNAQPAPLFGLDKVSNTFDKSFQIPNGPGPAWATFADGNADGIVSLSDQTAIAFNPGKTHARPIQSPYTDPILGIQNSLLPAINVNIPDDTVQQAALPKNEVVTISLGSLSTPLNDLYGVAIDLYFEPSGVNTAGITTNYSGSIFGSLGSDFIKIEDKTGVSSGRFSVGITRFNTTNVVASGDAAFTITLPLLANAPGGWFKVTAIPHGCNDKLGNPLTLIGGLDSLMINSTNPCNLNYWNGTVSTAWENPANWSCGTIPGPITVVYINANKQNYPVINSIATCKTLYTSPGVLVKVNTGFKLDVVGHN